MLNEVRDVTQYERGQHRRWYHDEYFDLYTWETYDGDLLGGAKTALVGNLVQNQFGQAGDWPYGSALSFLLMGVVLLGLWLYARVAGRRGLEELV